MLIALVVGAALAGESGVPPSCDMTGVDAYGRCTGQTAAWCGIYDDPTFENCGGSSSCGEVPGMGFRCIVRR